MTLTQWIGVGVLLLTAVGWVCAGISIVSWLDGDAD